MSDLDPDELANREIEEAAKGRESRPWRCTHLGIPNAMCADCAGSLEAHYECAIANWNIVITERDEIRHKLEASQHDNRHLRAEVKKQDGFCDVLRLRNLNYESDLKKCATELATLRVAHGMLERDFANYVARSDDDYENLHQQLRNTKRLNYVANQLHDLLDKVKCALENARDRIYGDPNSEGYDNLIRTITRNLEDVKECLKNYDRR